MLEIKVRVPDVATKGSVDVEAARVVTQIREELGHYTSAFVPDTRGEIFILQNLPETEVAAIRRRIQEMGLEIVE